MLTKAAAAAENYTNTVNILFHFYDGNLLFIFNEVGTLESDVS